MLDNIVRSFIPVEAFSHERLVRVEIPTPQVGLRWGRPSQFEWSNEEKRQRGGPTGFTADETEIPDYYIVEIEHPTIVYGKAFKTLPSGPQVRVSRIKTISFDYMNSIEHPDGYIQKHNYFYTLEFLLHPPSDG